MITASARVTAKAIHFFIALFSHDSFVLPLGYQFWPHFARKAPTRSGVGAFPTSFQRALGGINTCRPCRRLREPPEPAVRADRPPGSRWSGPSKPRWRHFPAPNEIGRAHV